MGAISSIDTLIARATAASSNGPPETVWFSKTERVNGVSPGTFTANLMNSLWMHDGVLWPGGAIPGTTFSSPTRATAGALPFTAPSGGRQKRVFGGAISNVRVLTMFLYDRVLHGSGLLAGAATAAVTQNITGGSALDRYNAADTCVGNEIWVEIYDLLGTTARALTVTYTNQDGATATADATVIGATNAREIGRLIRVGLAPGDTGVRGLVSVSVGDTGAAGNFGLTIARRVLEMQVHVQSVYSPHRNLLFAHPTVIHQDACLAAAVIPQVAYSEISGAILLAET